MMGVRSWTAVRASSSLRRLRRSSAEEFAEIHVRELRAHVENAGVWERGRRVAETLENGTDEAYRRLARLLPEATHWLLAAIPVKASVGDNQVSWNRRESKKWKRATLLAAHLFCGKDLLANGQRPSTCGYGGPGRGHTLAALEHLACSGK